ncbi:hypothetical protein HWV62_34583 [Athelia sp. TMB]|nr:hypothetical protein HWV62_34583 [Athelia sp. TMB]
MPRHSCSITLQLEHDSDYQFLNALRMASGYPAYHPAHISLISRLKVFSSLDPARSELAALVRELQLVAKRARPFRIGYLRMDPHTPFGKGAGCVALTVENTPDLNSLVAVLESSVNQQLAWIRKERNFVPHLTIDSSVLFLRRIANVCNAQMRRSHVTGLELWEHKEGRRTLLWAFRFRPARRPATRPHLNKPLHHRPRGGRLCSLEWNRI